MKNLSIKKEKNDDVKGYSCAYYCVTGCEDSCKAICLDTCDRGCTSRNHYDPRPSM